MCLFHVLLRRINVTNTSLMRLFSSSTRSVMCLFRVVLRRKYLLNSKYTCFTVQIRPKFMHIAPQMWQFYVFNMSCNVPLSCRFMPQQCHRRVLNVSVFNTSCNILLSCHFKSEILPKYTCFMVLYARNLRVLLRNCIGFTFSTGLVMYASYRLTSKILPKHTVMLCKYS